MVIHTDSFDPLINAEELSACLNDTNVVILDCSYFLPNQNRNAEDDFFECRIPGGRYFDIDAIADHSNTLPHMLPDPASFSEAAKQLGIGNNTRVVVYDNNSYMASARVWWTFRVFGHNKVSVLNGGLLNWLQLDQPVESGKQLPDIAPSSEYHATFHPDLVKNMQQMLTSIQDNSTQILDARSEGRFSGKEPEPRPNLRSGHIPGSHNLFFKHLVNEQNGKLKSNMDLEQEFINAGITLDRPVVTTCGTGVTAAILALGLYCIGNKSVAVYDGSWTEWGASRDTPVETL